MPLTEAQDIMQFWFGTGDPLANSSQWYKKDPQFDQHITDKYAPLIQRAKDGELDHWKNEPQSALALVILLDQFSRNAFRDTPEAFAQDPLALQVTLDTIEKGLDTELNAVERWFLYMPMMHSEDKDIQKKSVETYAQLLEQSPDEYKKAIGSAYSYAVKHAEIVFKFNRYPHRNEILGRESTAEEQQFLTQPGSSF